MKLLLATAFAFTATVIAQQGLPPELDSDLKINQNKQQANDFLGAHTRVARKVNRPWEYKESPWEQALEWVRDNKKSRNFDEEDYEDFKDCTEEYTETYEHYDEAMENNMRVNRPYYGCSIGGRVPELNEFLV